MSPRNAIDNFACEDLRLIDQFWRESSQGKFGFRVQKEIWQSNGSPTWYSPIEDWRKFLIELGWKTEESGIRGGGYVSYDNLGGFIDVTTSRRGNLPTEVGDLRRGSGVLAAVRGIDENLKGNYVFFSRAANCKL